MPTPACDPAHPSVRPLGPRWLRSGVTLIAAAAIVAACSSTPDTTGAPSPSGSALGGSTLPGTLVTDPSDPSGPGVEGDPRAAQAAPAELDLGGGVKVGGTNPPATAVPPTTAATATTAGGTSTSTTGAVTTTTQVPSDAVIQKIVDTYRTNHQIAGIAVTVVTPDSNGAEQRRTFVSGTPTVGSSESISATTVFQIGSETKTHTGALLQHLLATGRVHLDDEVQQYVPAGVTVPTWSNGTAMTLRHLATHEAGLPREPANLGTGPDAKADYTQAMLWQALGSTKLLYEPGTKWLYSNYDWGLLGAIVANVLQPGQPEPPYGPQIKAVLAVPLSLPATELQVPVPNLATPYAAPGKPAALWNNTGAIAGGGGLIADTQDMGLWMAATLGYPSALRDVLPRQLDQIAPVTETCTQTKQGLSCQPVTGFSMGNAWELHTSLPWYGAPIVHKNGGTTGSHSVMWLVPGKKTGVSVLANSPAAVDDLGKLVLLHL